MSISTMTVTIRKPQDGDFRDIRSDLEARIKSFEDLIAREIENFTKQQEKAAADHKQRLDSFKKALANYRNMLELEREMVHHNIINAGEISGSRTNEIKMPMPMAQMSLADFFCDRLKQLGTLSKERLRALAQQAGYFPDDEGRRQTHATLINITRNDRVHQLADGTYQLGDAERVS
jgi:hypothetical protein